MDLNFLEKGLNFNEDRSFLKGDFFRFTVDLDAPPHERWKDIAIRYKVEMGEIIDMIEGLLDGIIPGIFNFIEKSMADAAPRMPMPYRDEIQVSFEKSRV